MTLTWNTKNNFILLHFVVLHQQQHSDIDWSSIVDDISLEISSTPNLLKKQYEHLLETICPKQDSKFLHSTLKQIYLRSLCQKIQDDLELISEIVYEFIRHARNQRIYADDIEWLLNEWSFDCLSGNHKQYLFNILNRLRDYIRNLSNKDCQTTSQLDQHITIQEDDLESISDNSIEILTINTFKIEKNQSMNIDNLLKNTERKKISSIYHRRRTRSLTLFNRNKVNWFVPKLKRSSSLYDQYQLQLSQDFKYNNMHNNESFCLINNSNLRRTRAQPTISWLPLTDEQIIERDCGRKRSEFIEREQNNQIFDLDSESIETQRSLYQQEQRSYKRRCFS